MQNMFASHVIIAGNTTRGRKTMTYKSNKNINRCRLCGKLIPAHLNFCNLLHEDIFHEVNDTEFFYIKEEKYE